MSLIVSERVNFYIHSPQSSSNTLYCQRQADLVTRKTLEASGTVSEGCGGKSDIHSLEGMLEVPKDLCLEDM